MKKTVKDLDNEMYEHPDVSLAMQIRAAIQSVIKDGCVTEDDTLGLHVLNEIRQKIYKNSRNPDPMDFLLTMAGKTANPTEAALQYIEKLARA